MYPSISLFLCNVLFRTIHMKFGTVFSRCYLNPERYGYFYSLWCNLYVLVCWRAVWMLLSVKSMSTIYPKRSRKVTGEIQLHYIWMYFTFHQCQWMLPYKIPIQMSVPEPKRPLRLHVATMAWHGRKLHWLCHRKTQWGTVLPIPWQCIKVRDVLVKRFRIFLTHYLLRAPHMTMQSKLLTNTSVLKAVMMLNLNGSHFIQASNNHYIPHLKNLAIWLVENTVMVFYHAR